MTQSIVKMPINYFGDPFLSRTISNGSIYIGVAGEDPEVLANRYTIYLQNEDGTQTPISPAEQPVTTSSGGYPQYNGNIAQILVGDSSEPTTTDYSIKVLDRYGNQEFYFPSALAGQISDISSLYVFKFDTLDDVVNSDIITIGDALSVKERTEGNGGGADWDAVATSSVIVNDLDIVQSIAIPSISFVYRKDTLVNPLQLGANGDGVADDSDYLNRADELGDVVLTAAHAYAEDITFSNELIIDGGYLSPDNDYVVTFTNNQEIYTFFFGANGEDDNSDDTEAVRACVASAQASLLPIGIYGYVEITDTITYEGEPVTWLGARGAAFRTGTPFLAYSVLIWSGDDLPMIDSSTVGDYFEGIQTSNRGSATDFLFKGAGQRVYMHRMSFVTGAGEFAFSRSVIHSNGNRLGYSHFSAISCKGASAKFIDIDGDSSSNAVTPITINGRCIFETGGSDLTVVYVKDELIEQLKITDCTFNEKAGNELTVVDTSDTPLDPSINVFNFSDNEIDYDSSSPSTNRFARLTNVDNVIWNNNKGSFGGEIVAAVVLVNSSVSSFNGNEYQRLNGPYFFADSDSFVVVGKNKADTSNTNGATNNISTVGIVDVEYQSVMVLNPQLVDQRSNPIFRIDVTDSSGWQVRVSTDLPYWLKPGLRFTIQVRNISGANISAGSFDTGFVSGVLTTAPTDGNNVCYEFFWDGLIAQPILGVAPTQVSNT